MARAGDQTVPCTLCLQSFLTHGCTPVTCPICTDHDQSSLDRKAGPPEESGGGEWRCDACHRLFSDRTSLYHQEWTLLCRTCRARSEYTFAASSYVCSGDLKLLQGRRKSRSRQVPVVPPAGVRKRQLALVDVHQSSVEFKGVWYIVWTNTRDKLNLYVFLYTRPLFRSQLLRLSDCHYVLMYPLCLLWSTDTLYGHQTLRHFS